MRTQIQFLGTPNNIIRAVDPDLERKNWNLTCEKHGNCLVIVILLKCLKQIWTSLQFFVFMLDQDPHEIDANPQPSPLLLETCSIQDKIVPTFHTRISAFFLGPPVNKEASGLAVGGEELVQTHNTEMEERERGRMVGPEPWFPELFIYIRYIARLKRLIFNSSCWGVVCLVAGQAHSWRQ